MIRKVGVWDLDDTYWDMEAQARQVGIGDDYRDAREEMTPDSAARVYAKHFVGMPVEKAREMVLNAPRIDGAEEALFHMKNDGYFCSAVTGNPVSAVAELGIREMGFDHTMFQFRPRVVDGELRTPLKHIGVKEELVNDFVSRTGPDEVLVVTDQYDPVFRGTMEDSGYEVIEMEGSLTDEANMLFDRYVHRHSDVSGI